MTRLPIALIALCIAIVILVVLFVPTWLLITAVAAIYLAGFLLTLVVNLAPLGMVTFGLALLRSLVWPIWLATGWPRGEQMPMD